MDMQLNELAKDRSTYGVGGFFDVETTGLSPNTEEIVEMCLVLFVFEHVSGQIMGILDSYTCYNEPGKKIGKSAQKVHEITDAMVKGHKIDTDRVLAMMEISDFFLAHNASFDRGFLQKHLEFPETKKWYCSMNGINWRDKGYASKGLQNLLNAHGLAPQNHRADGDVMATLALLSLKNSDGIFYLYELINKKQTKRTSRNIHSTFPSITLTLPTSQVAATSSLTSQDNMQTLNRIDGKSKIMLYLLWLLTGLLGGHRYYMRDYWQGAIMTLTLGCYGIWTIVDLFIIGKRFNNKFPMNQ